MVQFGHFDTTQSIEMANTYQKFAHLGKVGLENVFTFFTFYGPMLCRVGQRCLKTLVG